MEAIVCEGSEMRTTIGVFEVAGVLGSDGLWRVAAYRRGSVDALARVTAEMPDDAVSQLRHQLATLWGELRESLWGAA